MFGYAFIHQDRFAGVSLTNLVFIGLALAMPVTWASGDDGGFWRHPICRPQPPGLAGFLFTLSDGRIIRIGANQTWTVKDFDTLWSAAMAGRDAWSKPRTIFTGGKPGIPANDVAVRTKSGAIVIVYRDSSTRQFGWDPDWQWAPHLEMKWRQDAWSIRSVDDGETWIHRQPIFWGGFVGWIHDMIVTRSGRVVVTIQEWVEEPQGHFVMRTYVSDDDGQSWHKSNAIDLGGDGNHDGALEAPLVQLSDGRLYMLLRTNLDRLWEAYSWDEGTTWLKIGPSRFDASTSPARLLRLQSGPIVLIWNRLYPEGLDASKQASYPRRGGGDGLTLRRSNWHRNELSVTVTEDETKTWSRPFVLLRDPKNDIVYVRMTEVRPGTIIVGCKGDARAQVMLEVDDLLRVTRKLGPWTDGDMSPYSSP